MKYNIYKIDNSIEKLLKNKHTLFLDQRELNIIRSKLQKQDYNIFFVNKSAEKVILYKKNVPNVSLFKIKSYGKLRHQDILGSILGLNISSSYLGDIIIDQDNYYFYILSDLSDFIKDNLNMIGNNKVSLEMVNCDILKNYERKYEELELIVSSNRLDNVVAKIINTSRENVSKLIKEKKIVLNYNLLNKNSYYLKDNDIFSIGKYGKYKFIGIIKKTKRNKIIIKCLKYI